MCIMIYFLKSNSIYARSFTIIITEYHTNTKTETEMLPFYS
jgi:hypothetical protein